MRSTIWAVVCLVIVSCSQANAERRWASKSGNYSVTGTLISVADGKAKLRSGDDKVLEIAVDKLDAASQSFIQKYQSSTSEAKIAGLQTTFSEIKEALSKRDVATAIRKATQVKSRTTSPQLLALVQRVDREVNAIDQIWSAYRQGAGMLKVGDRLTLKNGQYEVASRTSSKVVLSQDDKAFEFEISNHATIPQDVVLAIVRRVMNDADESRRAVGTFLSLDASVADQDRWLAAKRNMADVAVTTPKPEDQPQPKPVELAAAPSEDAQRESRIAIRELFKEQYDAAKDGAERLKHAGFLFEQAKETNDDLTAKFVLCSEAADDVAKLGDIASLQLILDHLSTRFRSSDVVVYKAKWLTELASSRFSKTLAVQESLLNSALDSIDDAVSHQKYEAANDLIKAARAAAVNLKAVDIRAALDKRRDQVRSYAGRLTSAKRALGILRDDPDNAEANRDVGVYYAFVLGRWDDGEPYLQKSGDEELLAIVALDSQKPTEPAEQVKTANAWLALSKTIAYKSDKFALRRRAAYWYNKALPKLSGIQKAGAEKSLAEAEVSAESITYVPKASKLLAELPIAGSTNVSSYSTSISRFSRTSSGTSLVRPVVVRGKSHQKAIWAKPADEDEAAKIAYALNKKYSLLRGTIALDESSGYGTSLRVQFRVDSPRKTLWQGTITPGQVVNFSVNVKGEDGIILVTVAEGSYSHPCWVNMMLTEK